MWLHMFSLYLISVPGPEEALYLALYLYFEGKNRCRGILSGKFEADIGSGGVG